MKRMQYYDELDGEENLSHINTTEPDLIVFCHLRWDFVFQRPQHLMSRFARNRRVYFFEEPQFSKLDFSYLHVSERNDGLKVVVPYLPKGIQPQKINSELAILVDELIEDEAITRFTSWYYTPMALPFTRHLNPETIIYDCMDELSAFKGAPAGIRELEAELLKKADVVFTGGVSLYEAKRNLHGNIHAFPSSIDGQHFRQARVEATELPDQLIIPGPRLGFFGVLDERLDIDLVDGVAQLRPDWSLVMIGPVVKIDPSSLPKRDNIHYLGMKDYKDLPKYLSGWDVAILPFARNESTKFISPTKTPEYLAAGRPVVSTSIRDVVRPYGQNDLVYIADEPEQFVKCSEMAMRDARENPNWLKKVDKFLDKMSWEGTCENMLALERQARETKTRILRIAKSKGFESHLGA